MSGTSWAMRLYNTTDEPGLIANGLGWYSDAIPIYLRDFDVDARDGRGSVSMTYSIDEARTWCSQYEVLLAWNTQSNVRPTRPDGRPNRPLTAYGMSAVHL